MKRKLLHKGNNGHILASHSKLVGYMQYVHIYAAYYTTTTNEPTGADGIKH